MKLIGFRIKEFREKAGWTQEELADKLGVTRVSVGNYERNTRNPDADIIVKLADLFDTSSDYLLGLSNLKIKHKDLLELKLVNDLAEELMNELYPIFEMLPPSDVNYFELEFECISHLKNAIKEAALKINERLDVLKKYYEFIERPDIYNTGIPRLLKEGGFDKKINMEVLAWAEKQLEAHKDPEA